MQIINGNQHVYNGADDYSALGKFIPEARQAIKEVYALEVEQHKQRKPMLQQNSYNMYKLERATEFLDELQEKLYAWGNYPKLFYFLDKDQIIATYLINVIRAQRKQNAKVSH